MTRDEALAIAKTYKKEIDNYTEYEDAFAFGYTKDEGFGGKSSPIIILKSNGKSISAVEYCDMPGDGKVLSEGNI